MKIKAYQNAPSPVETNKRLAKLAGSTNSNVKKLLRENEKQSREVFAHMKSPMKTTFFKPLSSMLKRLNIF